MKKRRKNGAQVPAFDLKRDTYSPDKVLVNWRVMRESLPEMSEAELEQALEHEREHEARKDFVFRIARRLAKVRNSREISAMLKDIPA